MAHLCCQKLWRRLALRARVWSRINNQAAFGGNFAKGAPSVIEKGSAFPSVAVKLVNAYGIMDTNSDEIFGAGRTVVFSVPGAFTPTCSVSHLPGFVAAAKDLHNKGIQRIICLAVNDHHVVKAWAEASKALGSVEFIADGTASLAKALGIDKDMAGTMGVRAKRAAFLVKDGIIEAAFTENQPGVVTSTGALAILEFID